MSTSKKTHPQPVSDRVGLNPNEGVNTVSQDRTWKDNAREFAALDRGEGWQFAILVACSVERRTNQRASTIVEAQKVSIAEFARAAGTSDVRVARYLDAWQDAAGKGWVQDASTLTPADAHTITPPDQPWRAKDGGVYDASKTGGQINNTAQIAEKAAKDPGYAARVLRDVAAAAPESVKREAFVDLSRDESIVDDVVTRTTASRNLDAAGSHVSDRLPHVREHQAAAAKQRGDLRFIGADAALLAAKQKIKYAAEEIHEAVIDDEHRELLKVRIEELRTLLGHLIAEIDGAASIDWDAELANMGGDL